MSPSIPNHIDYLHSTLDLATSCVWYLCQDHHRPDLTTDEIKENLVTRKYVLHSFAATAWLTLVEQALQVSSQGRSLPQLVNVLKFLASERENVEFIGDPEQEGEGETECSISTEPDIRTLLSRAKRFRQVYLSSQYKSQEATDPLSTSKTSRIIHQIDAAAFECNDSIHNRGCNCRIRTLYGHRPFKCALIGCQSFRSGFETQSARKSHEKNHDRPWKCSIASCEYAKGGFLSRSMRDKHLDYYHKRPNPKTDDIALEEPVDSSVESSTDLICGFIQVGDVQAVRLAMPFFKTLGDEDQTRIRFHAVAFGETPTIDLVFENHTFPSMMDYYRAFEASIEHQNLASMKFLLTRLRRGLEPSLGLHSSYDLFAKIMQTDSIELCSLYIDSLNWDAWKIMASKLGKGFLEQLISSAAGSSQKELWLIKLWDRLRLNKEYSRGEMNKWYINTASIGSVPLVEYWIKAGVDINHVSNNQMTALRLAAKNKSAMGAQVMQFLLLNGADPEAKCKIATKKIGDEVGAENIHEHLGITWEELVSQTRVGKKRETPQNDT